MKLPLKFDESWNKFFAILLIIAALLYDINPADLVTDLAPIVGWIDDIVITLISIINAYIQWKKGHQ